jgi:hypothetical protein
MGVKLQWPEADYSPSTSAKVKNNGMISLPASVHSGNVLVLCSTGAHFESGLCQRLS